MRRFAVCLATVLRQPFSSDGSSRKLGHRHDHLVLAWTTTLASVRPPLTLIIYAARPCTNVMRDCCPRAARASAAIAPCSCSGSGVPRVLGSKERCAGRTSTECTSGTGSTGWSTAAADYSKSRPHLCRSSRKREDARTISESWAGTTKWARPVLCFLFSPPHSREARHASTISEPPHLCELLGLGKLCGHFGSEILSFLQAVAHDGARLLYV